MRIKDGNGTAPRPTSLSRHPPSPLFPSTCSPHFWPRMYCILQISPLFTNRGGIWAEDCDASDAAVTKPSSNVAAPPPRSLDAPPSRNLLLMSAHQSFAAPLLRSALPPPPSSPIWTKRTKTCRNPGGRTRTSRRTTRMGSKMHTHTHTHVKRGHGLGWI